MRAKVRAIIEANRQKSGVRQQRRPTFHCRFCDRLIGNACHEYYCKENPDRKQPIPIPRKVYLPPPPLNNEARIGVDIYIDIRELDSMPSQNVYALMDGIAKIVAVQSN